MLWCSIDNDDSMDLDQLTVSEALPNGSVRLWVAIADVDALVPRDTPIDQHASTNTTSVYTSARIFPMLPERLSTDLTSLNPHEDRLAMVTEMVFNPDGSLAGSTVYRAKVRNQAKLAYDAVSAWLNGTGELPAAAAAVPGLDALLRTQDALAQQLRARRKGEGSLEFESFQPRVVFDGERVADIALQEHNRARQLIEEVMIATNTCTARYLAGQGMASLRRVVRSPERWLRIVAVAKEYGDVLPDEPNSKALEEFLAKRRRADPLRFPDLSLGHCQTHGARRIRAGGAGRPARGPLWPPRPPPRRARASPPARRSPRRSAARRRAWSGRPSSLLPRSAESRVRRPVADREEILQLAARTSISLT